MSQDLIDGLRAVNPVSDATPVRIEDVWRKLEAGAGSDAEITGLVPGRRARATQRGRRGGQGGLAAHSDRETEPPTRVRARATDRLRSRAGGAIALASSIAVVAAVITIVLAGHGPSPKSNRPPSNSRPATSTLRSARARVDPQVAAEFSVLTAPPRARDALPAGAKAELDPFRSQKPEVSGSRRVTASDGETAYLLPINRGACVVSSFAPICAPAAALPAAFSLDLCSPTLPVGRIELQWLMPDGATHITVRMANSSLLNFPSGYNVYIAMIRNHGSAPRSINWEQHGRHQTAIVGPPGGRSGKCEHPKNLPPASRLPTTTPGPVTTPDKSTRQGQVADRSRPRRRFHA